MRIEPDQKKTAATVVLLAVGFVALSWWPRQRERAELEARVEFNKKQLGVDRRGVQGIEELRERVADLRHQKETANRIVPPTSELADLLRRLNSELAAQDMHNQEVQTGAIVEGADFNVIPLTLKFEGDFEGVFAFVRSVESMSRLTRINLLQIIAEPGKTVAPLKTQIELTTFSATPERTQP